MKFILASASPRRKELLEQIGMKFEVRVSDAEEVTQATEPAEYVMELSFLKAEDVAFMKMCLITSLQRPCRGYVNKIKPSRRKARESQD